MNLKNILLSLSTGTLLLTTYAVINVNQNAAIAGSTSVTVDSPIKQKYSKELNLTDDQQTKIKQILQSGRQQIYSILTPEQQAKLKKAKEEHKKPKDLNLTDEQKTQIKAIRKSNKAQVMAVLTPEQQQKLQKLIQEKRESRQKSSS